MIIITYKTANHVYIADRVIFGHVFGAALFSLS